MNPQGPQYPQTMPQQGPTPRPMPPQPPFPLPPGRLLPPGMDYDRHWREMEEIRWMLRKIFDKLGCEDDRPKREERREERGEAHHERRDERDDRREEYRGEGGRRRRRDY